MAFNTIQINEAELQLINDISEGRKKTIDTLQAEIDVKNEFIQAIRPELAKKIVTLQVEIDELKKWISVKRELPEPNVLVIVCQIDAVFTARMLAKDYWESGNGLLIETPTHWMSLPKPPLIKK